MTLVGDGQVYAEAIGNIEIDALSAKKYYHFIRLMGRAASHITLECALQTHPQGAIICEEVEQQNMGLCDVVNQVWTSILWLGVRIWAQSFFGLCPLSIP
jgi:6-phosphofructokinase